MGFSRLRVFHEEGHPLNRRFIVAEDGKPFFYLGDTAWELFHRLDREEAELYLRDRAQKLAIRLYKPRVIAGKA